MRFNAEIKNVRDRLKGEHLGNNWDDGEKLTQSPFHFKQGSLKQIKYIVDPVF